jgi:hypothetical protein
MLSVVLPNNKNELRKFWKETQELVLIFSAVIKKL